MKKAKTPDPDGIPAEVWQNSNVARDLLPVFEFLKKFLNKETVPANLALCMYIRDDLQK